MTAAVAAIAVCAGATLLVVGRRARTVAVLAVIAVVVAVGLWQGAAAWRAVEPDRLGEWNGWASVVGDPAMRGRASLVTFEIEGERFDSYAYGSAAARLSRVAAGERVHIVGRRLAARPSDARRAAVRHVVGRLDIDVVGDVVPGSVAQTAANRVRRLLRDVATSTMADDEAALFSGLVIGDDARQSAEMLARFRSVGLSHLTAVSGQNVAFVLAAAGPLLLRLAPRRRWVASLALIGWFMVLTRFEPSVLRAGVMAMLGATAFVFGRSSSPVRLLAITVTILTTIDPMLVWSVGFWLSVSATLGVAVVAPAIERTLPLPRWCAMPLAVTLGAQVGVVVPSVVVFGRLPLVALVANPAAVPVAGLVMLVGIPSAVVAAVALRWSEGLGDAVMLPSRLGTRWVDQVARVAVTLEPPPALGVVGWGVVAAALLGMGWRNRVARHDDVPI